MHTHYTPFSKARIHLNVSINKRNSHYWIADHPKELHRKPLYSAEVTGWCGVVTGGPYFIDEYGAGVTVNFERYVTMLRIVLRPQI